MLFFSVGNETAPQRAAFERLRQFLATSPLPPRFEWDSARLPDEDHATTVVPAHHKGFRRVFADFQVPWNPRTGFPVGGVAGVQEHYKGLTEHYGFEVRPSEDAVNRLGYRYLGATPPDVAAAIAAFRWKAGMFPASPNVYSSLAEALEQAGQVGPALDNYERSVTLARERQGSAA